MAAPPEWEVVYEHVKTVVDGQVVADGVVEDAIVDIDIDFDRLTDDEGNGYLLVGEVDHPVEGTIHYRTRIQRAPIYVPPVDEAAHDHIIRSPTVPETRLRDGLDAWMASAASDDLVWVVVRGVVDPQRDIPPSVFALFPYDPAFAVQHELHRLQARELARTEAAQLRAPTIAAMEAEGGILLSELRAINAFTAEVTPSALQVLHDDPNVQFVEIARLADPDADGQDIRWAVQGQPYLDNGYDGSASTGYALNYQGSVINRVTIGVIDNQLDADHPVFQDNSGGSDRLVDYWYWNGLNWLRIGEAAAAARYDTLLSAPDHGTRVAHAALGDILDGQDASYTTSADRRKRSSMALEAKLQFVETGSASLADAFDKMYDVAPDIVNNSNSIKLQCGTTDYTHTTVDIVNVAAAEGVFWVQTPGNEGHAQSGSDYPCTAAIPAHASGAFVVNPALVNTDPLIDSDTTAQASRGANHPTTDGDDASSLISVVAPGGRNESTSASYDDDYDDVGGASSFAAPVVAGGAALLEHFLVDEFPGYVSEAGYAYAIMLLMADGRMEGSPAPIAGFDPFDSLWGGGYFRMRLFTDEGMDAPAKFGFGHGVLRNSQVVDIPLNGTNALPAAVDHVRAALWWIAPDLTPGNADLANIEFSGCTPTTCTSVPQNLDNKKRLRQEFPSGPPGTPLALRLEGVSIPADDWSGPCNNGSGNPAEWCDRVVFFAYYAEDQARDDADGPCAADGYGDTADTGCP